MDPSPPSAHRRPGGGFCNPWPGSTPHGFRDFLRWRFGQRIRNPPVPSPPRGSLPAKRPAIVAPRAAHGYRSATWVGHATVLLQLGPLNVLTDPMWSERASPFARIGPRRLMPPGVDFDALPPIDVVLLSHNHYDHLDEPTVRRIARAHPNAAWLSPLGLGELLRSFGVPHVTECDWWGRVATPAYSAMCTPAMHASARWLVDRDDTLWCGWTIAADDVRVFFAGDTALHPEFGAIASAAGPFDVVLLPIGAYEPRLFMKSVHMNPDDAVAAYADLARGTEPAPRCLPIHWGTFRLTDEPVDEPPRRFAQLFSEAGFSGDANWTLALGETRQFAR
ncbi:MAG: MBL fold metallo-hydrolase [Gemmatimonadaceae bacterium]